LKYRESILSMLQPFLQQLDAIFDRVHEIFQIMRQPSPVSAPVSHFDAIWRYETFQADELQIEPVEMKAGTSLAHQRTHREAGLEQSSCHRGSDEAAGSGDQDCCRGAHAFSLSDCT
jgi:hypothetical protein